MVKLLRQILSAISYNTVQQKRVADLLENEFKNALNKHEVVQEQRKENVEKKSLTLDFLGKLKRFENKTEAPTSANKK